MKTIVLPGYINRVVLGLGIAALVTFGVSMSRNHGADTNRTSVTAHQAIQVADGSESNGGKGGKGGAKRSSIA